MSFNHPHKRIGALGRPDAELMPDVDASRGAKAPSPLCTTFDAVVMLTWSDWHTEPRSNRYHYAMRFAARLPVYFVQPDGKGEAVAFEAIGECDITLVHIAPDYGRGQTNRLAGALRSRGVRRPLLWVYNPLFEDYVRYGNARFIVYHATEDYFCDPEDWAVCDDKIRAPLVRTLSTVDLLVGVSESVTKSYRRSDYRGFALTLGNGCDFGFWRASGAATYMSPSDGAKVALFQGGINARLDYRLLRELIDCKPEWQFWFCGQARAAGPEWGELAARPNVVDYGELHPDDIAKLARQACVGLIPFKQDALIRGSLPLKAFEYVACGLPVVTVPIDALASRSDLFRTETTAAGFASALDELAPSRMDANNVSHRLASAALESYDERFKRLEEAIADRVASRARGRARLNLLLLYDDYGTHSDAINDHIEAVQKYSRHSVTLMPASGNLPGLDIRGAIPDFSVFDGVLIYHSARLSLPQYIARVLEANHGPKLLFIQDEYETTEAALRWIEWCGIDAVFTTVPLDRIERVYPRLRLAGVDFLSTLTGYVPEDTDLDGYALPIRDRATLIGYRERQLSHQYKPSYDKFHIGIEVKRRAIELGLPVDIEVDRSKRLCGSEWYAFLGSCRAILGTENSAAVFDDGASLKRFAAINPGLPFPEVADGCLADRESETRTAQISPNIFEAIRLRTALILFEGNYSGVVEPDRHFIPLKKDLSNLDTVLQKIQDPDYLENITENAYRDIISETDLYSYETFVRRIDAHLDQCTRGRPRTKILSVPVLPTSIGEPLTLLTPESAGDLANEVVLGSGGLTRRAVYLLLTSSHFGMRAAKHTLIRSGRLSKHVAAQVRRKSAVFVRALRACATLLRSFRAGIVELAKRVSVIYVLLGDRDGARLLLHAMVRPHLVRPALVEVARLILARRRTRPAEAGEPEAVVLVPHVIGRRMEIYAAPASVAFALGLAEVAWKTLTNTGGKIEHCSLVLGKAKERRSWLLAEERVSLPYLAQWMDSQPGILARLLFGADAKRPEKSAPAMPPAEHNFAVMSAASRYPDLVPLLHDLECCGVDAIPVLPGSSFDLVNRVPAEPQRRSVLFLNQCYYNFKYLAAALRERGWDALVANLHPPDGPDSSYFHGDDINLWDPDPAYFKKRLHEFFEEVCGRFGIVHSYAVGSLGLFPWLWDSEPTHSLVAWDILEWRRRGILIGYTPTGCHDGVSQSTFGMWSPNSCVRCAWRERPDVCSDAKNRAWARKRDMLVDLIALDCGPAIDYNGSDKAFRGPLTGALDPEIWRPDLMPPEHLRRPRSSDDEILVYHGVGNYQMRTREGINIKGTHAVVAAVDALREEGIPIRLDFVDHVQSIDNRFVQVQADIIVDQLNHGRYGATAREGMMLGKPVVGRINPWDGDGTPATRCILETPVVNADETTIKDVLRDLALSPEKRAMIGRASRAHAIKWCSGPSLAERFERVYDIVRVNGRPPAEID